MSRAEFTQKTKLAAWQRAAGFCECGCGRPFGKNPKERPHYDHIIPDALGGDNSLENCACIRVDCHSIKTNKGRDSDRKKIAKAVRGEKDLRGLKSKARGFQTNRNGKFKAKIGGGIERR